MKRFFKIVSVVTAALLLPAVFVTSAFSVSDDDVPTLFHNDEAWYKDEIAPALLKDGILHVPSDFISMFDYITFATESEGENLLFTNTKTGDYVSILYSVRAACVNGKIVEAVSIFRENGYYYLDVEFICGNLGLMVEYSGEESITDRSVRVYDDERVMDFAELLSVYDEEELEMLPEAPVEEPDEGADYSPTPIYLICRDTRETEYVLARSLADRYGFDYSLFLTQETENIAALDMTEEIGLAVSSLAEAESLNDQIKSVFRQKTHLILTTGDEAADSQLATAGYHILKPDFTVDRTTDAEVMFGEIIKHAATYERAVVLLEDVWQSETLLLCLDALDKDYYDIGKIDGIN